MKNRLNFLFTIALCPVVGLFYSCGKEDVKAIDQTTTTNSDNILLSTPKDDINLNLNVQNGRVVFANHDELSTAMEMISDNENYSYTREGLDRWEKSMGFVSSRFEYERITDQMELLEDENDFQTLKNQISERYDFDSDDFPISNVRGFKARLTEGEFNSYIVGDYIHSFKGDVQIIIPIAMSSSIADIYANPEEYESDGVWIHNMTFDKKEINNRSCGPYGFRACTDFAVNNQIRISGLWTVDLVFTGYESNNDENWDLRYICTMQSHYKSNNVWKKNHYHNISWGTGYGYQYDITLDQCATFTHREKCGGASWTAKIWQIIYQKTMDSYIVPAADNGCKEIVNLSLLYNNNFVENIQVTGLFCESDCWIRGCN